MRKIMGILAILLLCLGVASAQVPPNVSRNDGGAFIDKLVTLLAYVRDRVPSSCSASITADDNGASLQAALNAAAENDTICTPSGPGVTISINLTVPGRVNFVQYSPITFSGSGVALTIGSVTLQPFKRTYRLWMIRATQSPWTSEADIGVRLVNVNTSDIHVVEVRGFTTGMQYLADGQCVCYNQTKLLMVLNNKYGVDITQQNGGAPNGNTFWGGRFTHNSGIGTGQSRYGVRFNSLDLTYTSANENRFYGPSFELGKTWAGSADAVPVLMLYGQNNAVIASRSEGNSPHFADVRNTSQLNQFDVLLLGGTSTLAIVHSSDNPGDSLITGGGPLKVRQQAMLDVWASGPFHKTWTGTTTIPGVAIGVSGSAVESAQDPSIIPTPTYVEVPGNRSLVRYLSTDSLKRFVVFLDADPSFGGRIWIRAYDAAGAVLTNADVDTPHVIGLSGAGFTYSSSFGGAYVTGSDTTTPRYFRVKDSVKSVAVLMTGGSLPLRIRGFRITAIDATGHATTWSNFDR